MYVLKTNLTILSQHRGRAQDRFPLTVRFSFSKNQRFFGYRPSSVATPFIASRVIQIILSIGILQNSMTM